MYSQAPMPPDNGGGGGAQEVFAKRLGEWRREQGWTQRHLANAVGVTEQSVHNWEQGRSLPSFKALQKLVVASGFTADWWLGLSDERR